MTSATKNVELFYDKKFVEFEMIHTEKKSEITHLTRYRLDLTKKFISLQSSHFK